MIIVILFIKNHSNVYTIIVSGVMYYILYDMNFKYTTNCIRSDDRLVDCVIKWKKNIAPCFMRKEAKAVKGSESCKRKRKL